MPSFFRSSRRTVNVRECCRGVASLARVSRARGGPIKSQCCSHPRARRRLPWAWHGSDPRQSCARRRRPCRRGATTCPTRSPPRASSSSPSLPAPSMAGAAARERICQQRSSRHARQPTGSMASSRAAGRCTRSSAPSSTLSPTSSGVHTCLVLLSGERGAVGGGADGANRGARGGRLGAARVDERARHRRARCRAGGAKSRRQRNDAAVAQPLAPPPAAVRAAAPTPSASATRASTSSTSPRAAACSYFGAALRELRDVRRRRRTADARGVV